MDVSLTGIFDPQTESAVKAFQIKYLSEIMGPWKVSSPSGYVYITTKKKINEISCNSVINLSDEYLVLINTYVKENKSSPTAVGLNTDKYIEIKDTANQVGLIVPTDTVIAPIVGVNTKMNEGNAASVSDTKASGGLWNFIKGVFGK